jgi:hypothetical protein
LYGSQPPTLLNIFNDRERKDLQMSRHLAVAAVLAIGIVSGLTLAAFIGEAFSQTPAPRQVASMGASEGTAWYLDLSSRRIVACRMRSEGIGCTSEQMP